MQVVAQTGWLDAREDEMVWPSAAAAGDVAVVVDVGPAEYNGPDGFVMQGKSRVRDGSRSASAVQVYTRVLGRGFDDVVPWSRFQGSRRAALVIFRGTSGVGRVRVNDGRVPVREFGGGVVLVGLPSAGSSLPAGWVWSDVTTAPFPLGGGQYHGAWGWAEAASEGAVGVGMDYASVAVEFLPPAGPGTPVITNPTPGEVSNAGPVDVSWQHRPSIPGGYQDRVQLRRESADGVEYWSGSAWSGSSSTIYSSDTELQVPGSGFVTGRVYDLGVRTREGLDGQWSDWSAPVTVTAVSPPSATVTAPDGVVHNNLTPTVTWTASTPRGEQTAFRVRVATSVGVQVHDSGWRQGDATEYRVPVLDWTQGGAYQVLLQVAQTGGSTSDYATSDFTVTWDTPAVPDVTADPGKTGVDVTVTGQRDSAIQVERIRTDGTWEQVASLEAGMGVVYEWTGIPHQSTSTRARGGVTLTNLITNPRGRDTSGTVVVRENLCTNPSAETDATGWGTYSGAGSTTNHTIDESWVGSGSVEMGSGGQYRHGLRYNGFDGIAGGTTITLACRFKFDPNNTGTPNHSSWSTIYRDDPASNTYETQGPNLTFHRELENGWHEIWSTHTVPDGITLTSIYFAVSTHTGEPDFAPGDIMWGDGMQIEVGTTLDDYFDGDTTPDSDLTPVWTGNPGSSTSQLTAPAPVGWIISPGIGYYSARHDAIAIIPDATGTLPRAYATETGTPDGRGYTWLVEATADEPGGQGVLSLGGAAAGGGVAGDRFPVPVGEWTTGRLPLVSTGGTIVYRLNTSVVGTPVPLYFRAALIDGTDTYDGEFFDGDTPDMDPVIGFTDTFAPYGRPTAWRARSATILGGQFMWSDWGTSDPVTSTDRLAYLASAVDPVRTWHRVLIVDDSEHTRQRPTAVAYGLGDDRPRVTYGVHRGQAGTLLVTAGHDDQAALDDLVALLESGEPLLLRWPAEGNHVEMIDAGTLTFSVTDSLSTARRAQVAVLRGRRISVPWVEQETPQLGASNAPITHPIEGDQS